MTGGSLLDLEFSRLEGRAVPCFTRVAMAICTVFTCTHCGFQIESWSDGLPYLRGTDGTRHYYCHPGEQGVWRERFEAEHRRPAGTPEELLAFVEATMGCELSYLCRHCGRQTRRDPERDSLRCTGCGRKDLHPLHELEGQTCPKCGQGTFHGEFTGAIS